MRFQSTFEYHACSACLRLAQNIRTVKARLSSDPQKLTVAMRAPIKKVNQRNNYQANGCCKGDDSLRIVKSRTVDTLFST